MLQPKHYLHLRRISSRAFGFWLFKVGLNMKKSEGSEQDILLRSSTILPMIFALKTIMLKSRF